MRARIALWSPGVTGINKHQTPAQVSQQWLCCRAGTGLVVPGLAAKPPTGISQESSQLAGNFVCLCAVHERVVIPQKQKKPGKDCLSCEGGAFVCASLEWSSPHAGQSSGSCDPEAAGIGDLPCFSLTLLSPLALFLPLFFSLSRASCHLFLPRRQSLNRNSS